MSYDLFFCVPAEREALTKEEFLDYFQDRKYYVLRDTMALYQNEDTGVYFSFEYGEGEDEPQMASAPDEAGLKLARVALNINYFRPSIFGLEAEPEVTEFVRHFGLLVDDPQNDGMRRGEYSSDGFLRGWNAGNLYGIWTIIKHNKGEKPPMLPVAEIQYCWRWNRQREKLQENLTGEIVVPRIMYLLHQSMPHPFVMWGDAMPIVLPKVDLLMLLLKDLAPKRLFGRQPQVALVEYEEVLRFFPDTAQPRRCSNIASSPTLYRPRRSWSSFKRKGPRSFSPPIHVVQWLKIDRHPTFGKRERPCRSATHGASSNYSRPRSGRS